MELTTIAKRNNPFRKLGGKILRSKYLILMIIPAIIFYIVFCYVPMYGILMAFQKFNPKVGIFIFVVVIVSSSILSKSLMMLNSG